MNIHKTLNIHTYIRDRYETYYYKLISSELYLKNDKIGQVANKDIVMACTALMPVYDSKGSGTFTFTCDKDPVEDTGAPPPLDTTKGAGRRKSKKNKKSRRNRKSRK